VESDWYELVKRFRRAIITQLQALVTSVRQSLCGMLCFSNMKRMGIDFGTKKIGIALSDDAGQMAFPHEVVPNDMNFLNYIIQLVEDRGVNEIIIGHSLNKDGQPNEVHNQVEELIGDITLQLGIPVHLEPEQYTTQAAIREQGRSDMTDASAAALILDSYIQKHK
jgi:putative Holliday junction resolvase